MTCVPLMVQVLVMWVMHLIYTGVSDVACTPVSILLPGVGQVWIPSCHLLILSERDTEAGEG